MSFFKKKLRNFGTHLFVLIYSNREDKKMPPVLKPIYQFPRRGVIYGIEGKLFTGEHFERVCNGPIV